MFVAVLLADEAVRSTGDPGVGAEDHNGVFCLRRSIERIEYATDLFVEVADVTEVFRKQFSHVLLSSRPRQQLFVANAHFTVVPRVLREKIGWYGNACGVVSQRVILRDNVRVMRTVKRHVTKIWIVAALCFDESDRLIGKDGAGVFVGLAGLADFPVLQLGERSGEGIGHASREHRAGLLEGFCDGRRIVVPFAGQECVVTISAKSRWPGLVAQEFFIDLKQLSARKQHRPGRNAGGTVEAALHVGVIEGKAAIDQSIKVRRFDMPIAQG